MTSGPRDKTTFRFSTDHFPERDRIGLWRVTIGKMVLKLDIEPLPDQRFYANVDLRASVAGSRLRLLGGEIPGRDQTILSDVFVPLVHLHDTGHASRITCAWTEGYIHAV